MYSTSMRRQESSKNPPTEVFLRLHGPRLLPAITFMATTSSAERQRIPLPLVESAGRCMSLRTLTAAWQSSPQTFVTLPFAACQLRFCHSDPILFKATTLAIYHPGHAHEGRVRCAEDLKSHVPRGTTPSERWDGVTSKSPRPGMKAKGGISRAKLVT